MRGVRRVQGEEPTGTFLSSLKAAYDDGFLTKEDLEQIAYYNNNHEKPEEELDSKIEQAIKEALAEEARNNEYDAYPDADAKDYEIMEYFGEYGGCYVFRADNPYGVYSDDLYVEWVEIGGVRFRVTHFRIRIWKTNE